MSIFSSSRSHSSAFVLGKQPSALPLTLNGMAGPTCYNPIAATGRVHRQLGNWEIHRMKGNPEVIAYLNEVLKAELTAINQYFLHAEMCENWGYVKLARYGKKESIDEMKHAEACIERILYLDGTPSMHELFPLRIGQNVKAQIENDLALEIEAVARLNNAINKAAEAKDNGSRDLFQRILVDEEHHIDFLEAQLHLISEIGIENYLAQQIEMEG
jgi:bacterioferritin